MSFDLELPDVEEVKEKVAEELAVSDERQETVDETAKKKVEEIMGTDISVFEDRKNLTTAFEEFGADVMRKTESKNSILSKRMGELSKAGSESGEVAKGLQELAEQMKGLDPSLVDFDQKGLFGKISNPVKRYFDKYKTADAQIADIVKSLENGKKMLKNDNVTLEIEQADMRALTKELNEKIAMGNALDQYLSNAVENKKAEGGEEEKVRFVEEEVLFPLRQRIMDFQQMQVVSQQGCVAMDVIRRNNNELIRAVDRAETVTVSSLRTAVTVAGALYNQRIVLEKVNLLNESTNRMIASTAEMLKTQGVEIQKQSSEAMISTETLRKSFEDTLQAMTDISNYKLEALPRIRKTIEEFKELAEMVERKRQRTGDAGAFMPSGEQQAIEEKKKPRRAGLDRTQIQEDMSMDGRPGCGSIFLGVLAVCAVLYYGFNVTSVGWFLKLTVAVFLLLVIAVVGLVTWIIMEKLKKDKLAEEEKARKAAEQNAQRFEEQRGSDDGSHV